MPLFMDRHSIPGATAKDAAEAHLSDLAVSGRHGVQFLSYWFDADNEDLFCLADASDPKDLEAVHRESHGLIPNEIISVSEDDVLRFLDRIHDPVDDTEVTNPFRTILFTDLEGSTALTEAVGMSAFMVLLTEHDLIIRRALVAWRGREVKHTGDGILSSFDEVSNALECALAIQHGFRIRASEGGGSDLRVRIGLAAGEPVDHNDDIYGSSVNLASRLCEAADPEHILVSDVVRDLGAEEGFIFHDVDRLVLKGFSDPVAAFELVSNGS